jgi:hypothetical protein
MDRAAWMSMLQSLQAAYDHSRKSAQSRPLDRTSSLDAGSVNARAVSGSNAKEELNLRKSSMRSRPLYQPKPNRRGSPAHHRE